MDLLLLLAPLIVAALVALLLLAGCGLAHPATGPQLVMVVIDFDDAAVGLVDYTLTIDRTTSTAGMITTTINGGPATRVTVEGALLEVTVRPGRGTRRIDISQTREPETWTIACGVGVIRTGSDTVERATATAAPLRVVSIRSDSVPFFIDATSPDRVTLATGFR